MEDFLVVTKDLGNKIAEVNGIFCNRTVHIHVSSERYHLYENTIVTPELEVVIKYCQLVLSGVVKER